ncbi:MAG: AI-2E family transporter [Patescibacteria group bacterium]|nr:AI-2E family transporter [Patescibacteria group bacterium]
MKKSISKPFLIFLILASIVGLFFLFKPFLVQIIIAAVLVSVFYPWYERLAKFLWNKKYLASFIMCLALLLIIIIPVSNLMIMLSKKAVSAYDSVSVVISRADTFQAGLLEKIDLDNSNKEIIRNFIIDTTRNISDWLVSGTTDIVKGTTSFVISLLLILLTMLFFFVEGKNMAEKLVLWSPLPNKYDLEIIRKFRRVSQTTLISIFVMALSQGILGGLGFLIIGWPFIFTAIIIAFLSLIPYIGSAIFYIPAAIYLIISGQVWQGLFVIIWCWFIINNVNEIIRAHIIKGRAEVNPIFIIFSIIGGISWFGFWGIIIGPLIVALAITIFHIYELEYNGNLEE